MRNHTWRMSSEDLVNLPTDSKPKDLSDIDSEDYDDIDPEQ